MKLSIDELRRLFQKQVPAAYESLQEAETMPENEARRYKIHSALQTIERAQSLVMSCDEEISAKDELMLMHITENVPCETTARIFYDYVDEDPGRAAHNIIALQSLALKKLHKALSHCKAFSIEMENDRQESMVERLKAKEQRMKG